MSKSQETQIQILRLLLRPIARFCLNRSIKLQEIYQALKIVLVETADEEIRKSTTKINASRVAMMTGVYREDIPKILASKDNYEGGAQNTLTRVIGQWEQDRAFCTKSGQPRVLDWGEYSSEFHKLVGKVSKNINPATVLFELKRIGAVQETKKGIKLVKGGQPLKGDPKKVYDLLARDVETLMGVVAENQGEPRYGVENLHIRTEYDNVYVKHLPEIKRWFIEHGKEFHRRAREFISQFDKDLAPNTSEDRAGGKVTLQAFGFVDEKN